ncbi:MAG: sensor domain-containing diguanylate cyclase [Gammaproteobacteria bacterium]|nr:sensor domain-containing diguanylate cyclase [Gammaproteobacteria bacterium]
MIEDSIKNSHSLHDGYLVLVDALSAIRQLSDIDLGILSEPDFLEQVLVVLATHQDLGGCSVFLTEGEWLACVAGTNVSQRFHSFATRVSSSYSGEVRFSVNDGLMGSTCRTGEIQYCPDCEDDERFKPFRGLDLFHDTGSLVCVPLKSGNHVLGVLNLSHPKAHFFEPPHQQFLLLFANCMGRSLETHRLLHNLKGQVAARTHELEQALQESDDLRRRYQRLSTIDELTGLHNRRFFFAEGESMLARANRYEMPLSLLLIDVDYFKRINDTWGHAVGDKVLKMITEVLRSEVRAGDICVRMGGEEFILLLSNTGCVGADLLAKRVQEKIGQLDLGGEMQGLLVTVSIGMTSLNGTIANELSETLDLLYRQADTAMYRCKEQGRNCRMFYTQGMGRLGVATDHASEKAR